MNSGYAYAKALRTVKTCVGSQFCRYGTQDSLSLGIEIEKRLEGLAAPAKLKLGISGCPRNCAESAIKDVGIVGVQGGWEIYAGGCAGIKLKGGTLIATVKSGAEAMEISGAFIQLYREEANYGERAAFWLERFGVEKAKNLIMNEEPRKGLLERLDTALCVVKDPWGTNACGRHAQG
jgi:nitrite reductase (NADH) large subunit